MSERDPRQHLESLLRVHRKNLDRLELQAAQYGLALPLQLQNEIDIQQEQIAEVEGRLRLLDAPAAPSQAIPARLNNLPAPSAALVGRAHELAEAQRLLTLPGVRLLTLTGPGGTGKTRLSLEIAATLLSSFADGVCFVGLAAISDPTLVAPTIAQALEMQEEGNTELAASLKAGLRDKTLLLVLDNFEQLLAAARLVSELLAAARGLKVLVSSRASLRVSGEREMPVLPLALPNLKRLPAPAELAHYPAVVLFLDRAQAARPGFALNEANAAAVAEICVRLDGLPLALELAAARCKMLAPAALLQRLDSRLKLLTGGARDLDARQQTLRGAIDWSYNLLDPGEQALFARLAAFVGGCTFEAIDALCSDPALDPLDGDVLDGMGSLVDKSLLRQAEEADGTLRFTMLETIREYARERLDANVEAEAVRAAHAAHFLALAQQAEPELTGPDQAQWLERLEGEHDNLRAALGWALEHQHVDLALQLGGSLWRFWYTRGHLSESRRWLERALERTQAAPPTIQAKALSGIGVISWAQGNLEAARGYQEQALALYRQLGDKAGMARALNVLGVVAQNQGEYPVAQKQYAESVALFKALGDRWGLASALSNLGIVFQHQNNLDQAHKLYAQSLALRQTLQDRRGMAVSLGNMGEVALLQGNLSQARDWYLQSLKLCKEVEDQEGIAACLEFLAGVSVRQRSGPRAARLLGAAEALREAIATPITQVELSQYEATVAAARALLSPEAFLSAWASGRALSLAQAIAVANEAEKS